MKKIVGILFLLSLMVSCYRDKEELLYPNQFGDTSTVVTYNGFVKPLIAARCVACHSAYGDYNGLKVIVSNGKFADRVIVKKDMPSGSSLDATQIAKLDKWVKAGAPNN